jgi:ribosomal protein RSM22 (predicted rRNA methylase)
VQRVRATVTLTRLLHVHVSPNHAGERVLIEQRTKHGWKVIARPRLTRLTRSSSSQGSVPVAIVSGTVDLRAVFPGDGRNARSISPVVRVTR